MKRGWVVLSLFIAWGGVCFAQSSGPLLLQSPALSKTQIAFAYGGDIWIVDRNGGDARRLVTGLTQATMTATKTFTWCLRRAASHAA